MEIQSKQKVANEAQKDPSDSRRNLLLVMFDDIGVEQLEVYGVGPAPYPRTGTLDWLAAHGTLYRRAYGSPLCSPSRAMLQTGLPSWQNGIGRLVGETDPVGLMPTNPALARRLRRAGYRTALLGKWHLANEDVNADMSHPREFGYDAWEGSWRNLGHQGGGYTAWQKQSMVNGSSLCQVYATQQVADDAIAFIQEEDDRPWFACVCFHAAHVPLHTPPLGEYEVDLPGEDPEPGNNWPWYCAAIESMDYHLERIIEAVEASGSDPVIVVMGDNGSPGKVIRAPFDGAHDKGTVYEGGCRIPLIATRSIVRANGQPATSDALLSPIDIHKELLWHAGWGPAASPENPVVVVEHFSELGASLTSEFHERAAIGPRFKLIRRRSLTAVPEEEFYDLAGAQTEGAPIDPVMSGPEAAEAYARLAQEFTQEKGWQV